MTSPDRVPAGRRPAAAPASIPPDRAPRETLQDFVYGRIKDLILNGEIEPGRTITIPSLAQAFAVSHMPVREALHRLTAERALTVVQGRSVGVAPLTVEGLRDLTRVRLEVEGLAAAWAAERATPETQLQVAGLVADLDGAVEPTEAKRYLRANRALHFTVYAAAGSPALIALIESLWLQISPYFGLLRASGNYAEANRSHRALAAALRAGSPSGARSAIQQDITAASAILENLLENH
jgi:DNA-binding GntR family transcriptional regulator